MKSLMLSFMSPNRDLILNDSFVLSLEWNLESVNQE